MHSFGRLVLGVYIAQKGILPRQMSNSMTQSESFAIQGLLNAAGLLCSNKKCPVQAKGYTMKGRKTNSGTNHQLAVMHNAMMRLR